MRVTIDELLAYYEDNNKKDLCEGCVQQGDILFPADEYQDSESVCKECILEKLKDDDDFQMTRYYKGDDI
jgi:hypothetical protein